MEERESEKPIKAGIITGVTQSRAEFLRTATPLAVVAALGIPLSSCGVTDSGDDSDTNVNEDNDNTDDSNNNDGGGNSASAFSVDGNTITIDTSVSGGEA